MESAFFTRGTRSVWRVRWCKNDFVTHLPINENAAAVSFVPNSKIFSTEARNSTLQSADSNKNERIERRVIRLLRCRTSGSDAFQC
jgi:hypothetical protein